MTYCTGDGVERSQDLASKRPRTPSVIILDEWKSNAEPCHVYSFNPLLGLYEALGNRLTKLQTPGCYTVGLMCTHLLHKSRDLSSGFLELNLFLIASPLFLVSCCHHHNIPEGTVWCVCVCVHRWVTKKSVKARTDLMITIFDHVS